MSLWQSFKTVLKSGMAQPGAQLASPWSNPPAGRFEFPEGLELVEVSREYAMQVPAVAKARALIVSIGLSYPLVQRGANGDPLPVQPGWLSDTSGEVSPRERMGWTLDDLIFQGMAVWGVKRDTAGVIEDAVRIPPQYWQWDAQREVLTVTDPHTNTTTEPSADDALIFTSPTDPILRMAAQTIRGAHRLEEAWIRAASSPALLYVLSEQVDSQTGGQLTPEEAADLLEEYAESASDPTHPGWVFTPRGYGLQELGRADASLLVDGRNAATVDIARFMHVPAMMLDASYVNSTLNYNTREGQRSEYAVQTVEFWASTIEGRLSLDDVSPEHASIAFDLSALADPNIPYPEWKD